MAVALTASSVSDGVPVTNDPTAVEVAGTRGQLLDLGSGHLRLLFGPVSGRWATLDAFGLDRASVVAIGASVTPAADGESLVLPPSALPSGLVERAVGHDDGVRFVPASAENSPIPVAYWTDGNVFLRYLSYRAPADTLAVYRLGASEVIDTTIGSRSVFIATLGGRRYAGWAEGDRLYVVETANADDATPVPIDLFIDYLGRLRPATAAEWSAMQAPATTPNGSPVTTTPIFRAAGWEPAGFSEPNHACRRHPGSATLLLLHASACGSGPGGSPEASAPGPRWREWGCRSPAGGAYWKRSG